MSFGEHIQTEICISHAHGRTHHHIFFFILFDQIYLQFITHTIEFIPLLWLFQSIILRYFCDRETNNHEVENALWRWTSLSRYDYTAPFITFRSGSEHKSVLRRIFFMSFISVWRYKYRIDGRFLSGWFILSDSLVGVEMIFFVFHCNIKTNHSITRNLQRSLCFSIHNTFTCRCTSMTETQISHKIFLCVCRGWKFHFDTVFL